MKDAESKIGNLIDQQNVSFISSVDEEGFPNTKAMLAPVKRNGIKEIFWHTNAGSMRIKQFSKNSKACVYFCDNRSFRGIMLVGNMEIVQDKAIMQELWKDDYNIYYKDGVFGGDYTVIKFTAIKGRYYSNFKSADIIVEKGDYGRHPFGARGKNVGNARNVKRNLR
jgi:general stress protein 26